METPRKGYQLIFSMLVDSLFLMPKDFDYRVAILSWLIHKVQLELGDQLGDAQIEVIRITHHHPDNTYPALGIHYPTLSKDTPDLEPIVIATMDKLLQETPAIEMLRFMGAKGTDWKAKAAEIMRD